MATAVKISDNLVERARIQIAPERSLGCAVLLACLLSSGLGGRTWAFSRTKPHTPCNKKGAGGDCGGTMIDVQFNEY